MSTGLAGCSRTGLYAQGFDEEELDASAIDVNAIDGHESGVGEIDAPAPVDAAREPLPPIADAAPDNPRLPDASPDPRCTPAEEACNGVDDDCNGQVDDGIAPIPCPAGGFRYCVGGRMSACPTRCEVCVPGSQRVCFISYCLYWGTQTCAADGKGFGPCREQRPPAACDATARTHGASLELERCCVDNGYCCLDTYDLDRDGDRGEILGACGGVNCEP